MEPAHELLLDEPQLPLVFLLSLLTIVAAWIAERQKNVFLTLLALNLSVFHVFRAFTIRQTLFYGYPRVQKLTPEDMTEGLIVLILFVLIFILLLNGQRLVDSKVKSVKPENVKGVVLITIFSIFSFFFQKLIPPGFFKEVLTFLNLVVQKDLVFLLMVVYFLLLKKYSEENYKKTFLFLITLYVIGDTLGGNKSGIYKAVFMYLFAYLSVYGIPSFRLRDLSLLSLGAIMAILFYFIGNAIRIQLRDNDRRVNFEMFADALSLEDNIYLLALEFGLANVSERIGYLEEVAKFVRDKEEFEQVMNPGYYSKSFIRNTIPKVQTFDVIRASNSVVDIDNYGKVPSRTEYLKGEYHSEIFTGYGEFYVLGRGKIGGVLIVIFICLIFRNGVKIINDSEVGVGVFIKSAILFWAFYALILDSFGLDWGINRLFFLYLFYLFFKNLYTLKIETH